jgi:hypothetical protein
MRYMLLIYGDPSLAESMTPEEDQKVMTDYLAFTQSIVESGEMVSGEPLQGVETATTVRVRGGRTAATDGPFAETKEVLGGFYVVDCKDLDRALELAARIPGAHAGSVEVRPIMEMAADLGAQPG